MHNLILEVYKIHTRAMCITFFHLKPNSPIKFILAFNRDQNAARGTLPFGSFEDDPNIYAGKDVVAGGSWLGINIKTGIMVILTNYKKLRPKQRKSRGLLVRFFLQTNYTADLKNQEDPQQLNYKIYRNMTQILENQIYSSFNISVYNIRANKIFYMCSQTSMKSPMVLSPDKTHGYSNTDINTLWRKVERGKLLFDQLANKMDWDQKPIKKETIQKTFSQMQQIMRNRSCQGFGCLKMLQSSIFIQPYYNLFFKCHRMTKSTFYAIFSQKQDGFITLDLKEVTYSIDGSESEKLITLKIKK